MAKKVEIEIDVQGNIVESTANLRKLKAALKEIPAGTAEWDKVKNQIRDIEDSIQSASQKSEDFKGLLEAAPGPLGALGRGIKSVELATKSWGAALKATGIGLLVSLVAGLAAAFAQSEEAGKKLKPLFEGFQRILQGVFRALEPVFNMLVDLALKALPYVEKAFSVAYSAMSSFLQGLGLLGSALKKFITGDFTGAWEDAGNAVTGFGKRYDEAQQNFVKGTKELTEAEKEELKKRQEAEKAALEKRRQQQEEYRKQVEADTKTANDKLLSLQNEYEQLSAKSEIEANQIKLRQDFEQEQKEINALKLKNQTINGILVSAEDLRSKLLLQAKENYQKKLKALEEQDFQRFKDQTDKTVDLNTQFILKLNQLTAESIEDAYEKKKAQRTNQYIDEVQDLKKLEQSLVDSYKEIIKQYPAAREDMENGIAIIIEKAKIAQRLISENADRDLAAIDKEAAKDREATLMKQLDNELRILELRGQVLNQKTQAYFRNQTELLEKTYEKEKLLQEQNFAELLDKAKDDAEEYEKIEKQKAEVLLGIEKKYQEDKKNLKQQEIAAYGEVASATINSFAAITGALAAGYDEEAKTSKKAFEQRKKLQIATALMSAASGVIQILTQPSTLPSPFDWIVKVANAAALGITTAINIANIKKTKFEGTEGGGEAAGGNRMGRGYADGGIVRGPGTSKSDSIPARLSNGEAVMTSGAVTMFAPLLSMMNQMGGGTSFNSGLNATLPDNPNRANPSMEQQPLIMKTYVVENELTSSQQRQARLKDLSTL